MLKTMKVGLSFDVEDLNAAFGDPDKYGDSPPSDDFYRQYDQLLTLLKTLDITSSLYFVGTMVKHIPELIKRASKEGHEIGVHGYRHKPVNRDTFIELERNLPQVCETIESLTGKQPTGFRAPYLSVTQDQRSRLFSLLQQVGFNYDTSTLAKPGANQLIHHLPEGIANIPLSNKRLLNRPIIMGGGYFRLLPYTLFKRLLNQSAVDNMATLYLHSYELFEQGEITERFNHGWKMDLRLWLIKNTTGSNVREKFIQMAQDFELVSYAQLIDTSFRQTQTDLNKENKNVITQ